MEKKVDSEWKKRAEEEKEKFSHQETPPPQYKVSFLNFISEYAYQAMICLGHVEHPVSKSRQKDLPQAKYVIDTLEMIEEKTKNNLNPEEALSLKNLLHQLRMAYVQGLSEPASKPEEEKQKEK